MPPDIIPVRRENTPLRAPLPQPTDQDLLTSMVARAGLQEIGRQQQSLRRSEQLAQRARQTPARLDLRPLAQLVDAFTGSRFAATTRAEPTPEERARQGIATEGAVQSQRNALLKNIGDVVKQSSARSAAGLKLLGKAFKNEKDLRDEWRKSKTSQITEIATVQAGKIRAAAQKGNAQGDLAMIFAFMKMLDPTSVVRESEYAAAANTRGVFEAAQAWLPRLKRGERLPPEQRERFVSMASEFEGIQLGAQDELNDYYTQLASFHNVEPKNVIRPFGQKGIIDRPKRGDAIRRALTQNQTPVPANITEGDVDSMSLEQLRAAGLAD